MKCMTCGYRFSGHSHSTNLRISHSNGFIGAPSVLRGLHTSMEQCPTSELGSMLTKTRKCTVSRRVRIWPCKAWISARRLVLSSSRMLIVASSYISHIHLDQNIRRKLQPSDKPVCCADGGPGYLDPAVNTNTQISNDPVSNCE
jgi:hypothetical protein